MQSSKSLTFKARIKKALGVTFRSNRFLLSALTHPSYRNENACPDLEDFDRLEFFGDSLLNFVVCRRLYQKFPDADEGLLSRLRSILVSRKVLSRVAVKMGLPRLIRLGKSLHQQKKPGQVKDHFRLSRGPLGCVLFRPRFRDDRTLCH